MKRAQTFPIITLASKQAHDFQLHFCNARALLFWFILDAFIPFRLHFLYFCVWLAACLQWLNVTPSLHSLMLGLACWQQTRRAAGKKCWEKEFYFCASHLCSFICWLADWLTGWLACLCEMKPLMRWCDALETMLAHSMHRGIHANECLAAG